MLVTTVYQPSPKTVEKATVLAEFYGCRLVERRRDTLPRLRKAWRTEQICVVGEHQLFYYQGDEEPLYFHPNTSLLRIQNMQRGLSDPLIKAAGLQPGDTVLDCTAGMGSDAIVLAYATGANGHVCALESEKVIFSLLKDGLQHYAAALDESESQTALAMQRIVCYHADHESYLRQQPSDRFDVVYFDPMFRNPVAESSWIRPLRAVSNPHALQPAAVAEAKRVAKKAVVLKERKYSTEFRRLGFTPYYRDKSKIAYGVIRCDATKTEAAGAGRTYRDR